MIPEARDAHSDKSLIAPFPELSSGARARLFAGGREGCYAAGAVLDTAGSAADGMYVILEGRVRILRGGAGRPHIIHEELAGGTIGDVPVLEGGTYPATAIAAEPLRCIFLSRDHVSAAIHAEPEIAVAFLARMARRVRSLVDQLDSRTSMGVRERLAALILEQSLLQTRDDGSFTLGGTQQDVAESLGTVRELVGRTLREFRDDAIVDAVGRGRYKLRDRPKLKRIASQEKEYRGKPA